MPTKLSVCSRERDSCRPTVWIGPRDFFLARRNYIDFKWEMSYRVSILTNCQPQLPQPVSMSWVVAPQNWWFNPTFPFESFVFSFMSRVGVTRADNSCKHQETCPTWNDVVRRLNQVIAVLQTSQRLVFTINAGTWELNCRRNGQFDRQLRMYLCVARPKWRLWFDYASNAL